MTCVLLTGANGVVGIPLSERFLKAGINFYKVSRSGLSQDDNVQWDMEQALGDQRIEQLRLAKIDTLIHCSPIWLLPAHLSDLLAIGVRRIVAFSSSSVISKNNSSDTGEYLLVQQLSNAEKNLTEFCNAHDIALTIFRPSMIYGHCRDQNITHIAKFIKRYSFMFLVGRANGLRQPVHADDLAEASLSVLDNASTIGKTYHLAGATTLTYRAMVEAVFDGLDKRSRIISLPLIIFRNALKIVTLFSRFSYTPEMANRMNQNLNYDISNAQNDFSYSPQVFLSQPERDLP